MTSTGPDGTVRVRTAEIDRAGRRLDLRNADIAPAELVAAAREADDARIHAPVGGPLYERAGYITRSLRLSLRPALAEAMRTRTIETSVDHELARTQRTLAELSTPTVDLRAAREAVAAATTEEAALRERVARLGGRTEAFRELGEPPETEALEAAATALSEAETERVAAEQQLRRARIRAQEARDARARQRRLEDRLANRQRTARTELVEAGWPVFRRAVAALPVTVTAGDSPPSWDGPDWVTALALFRIAEAEAPIIVDAELLETSDIHALLGVPIIRV
ncbi:MAG: hypothetical protein ABEJ35_03105 [Halobacteriaceae archaeon]